MAGEVQDALDESIHGEAAHVFYVIPFKMDDGNFGAFPILGDGEM